MTGISPTSRLQQAIDIAETLSLEEQRSLLEILSKRLQSKDRQRLLADIQSIRQEASEGNIKYGSVQDFLAELDT